MNRWTTAGEIIQTSLGAFFCIAVFLYPIIVTYWMLVNFERFANPLFEKKYGALYESCVHDSKSVILYRFVYLMRRMSICLICMFSDQFILQIIVFFTQQVIAISVMGLNFFSTREKHYREVLNEQVIMLVGYHVMCFSAFVPDIPTRGILGLSVAIIMSLHFIVSIGNLLFIGIRQILRDNKQRMLLKGHLKRMGKVRKKKLYNWESWEKKRAIAAAEVDEDEVERILQLNKSPMRSRTDRERSVFRISVDRFEGLNGEEPPRLQVVNSEQSFENSETSIMTGDDEQPSMVMNEADMLQGQKQRPTLKRGKSQNTLVRKKTVTIGEEFTTIND